MAIGSCEETREPLYHDRFVVQVQEMVAEVLEKREDLKLWDKKEEWENVVLLLLWARVAWEKWEPMRLVCTFCVCCLKMILEYY
jgi:hypothetical protein